MRLGFQRQIDEDARQIKQPANQAVTKTMCRALIQSMRCTSIVVVAPAQAGAQWRSFEVTGFQPALE